jgi:hypothetical protein
MARSQWTAHLTPESPRLCKRVELSQAWRSRRGQAYGQEDLRIRICGAVTLLLSSVEISLPPPKAHSYAEAS